MNTYWPMISLVSEKFAYLLQVYEMLEVILITLIIFSGE